jgi:hypothetical protein
MLFEYVSDENRRYDYDSVVKDIIDIGPMLLLRNC